MKDALIQNKRCRRHMFEITLFFLLFDRFCAADWRMLSWRSWSSLGQTHLMGKNLLNITEISSWPCCDFVKGVLTQNKHCRHYMFEIICFFLFLVDSVHQIDRYCRKGICPIWAKNTLWARIHKNIVKIKIFHVSAKFPFFACTSTSLEHITLRVFYRPPRKSTGGISDVFVYFSCRSELYYLPVVGRVIMKNFPTCNNFFFRVRCAWE